MTNWYEQSVNALQLAGKGDRTQQCYTRAVRMLVDHFIKTPDLITEEELQAYFLHRRNESNWSASTMRIHYCGIRFFFANVLKRDWHLFNYLRAKVERRLPEVLSRQEVRKIFSCVNTFRNLAFFKTVYSCGLRLSEAQHLQVADIDSTRKLIHVHRGKGAKDRLVPLPESTYNILRKHWADHRNPRLIFPAWGRNGKSAPTSQAPMAKASVQGALRRALFQAEINKRRITLHTFRHSYATHLLENGVNVRLIQKYMGHLSLETTMIYLHLTKVGQEDAYLRINRLMEDL